METAIILNIAATIASKSAELADKDPHGLIISLVSVTMVFLCLIILYIAFVIIGKLTSGHINIQTDNQDKDEVYASIGMAMHQYLNESVHDNESYTITIKRK